MTVLAAVAIGFVAGVAAGVAGIGGGVILVPAMVFLLGLDQHTAEGTSLLAIAFSAVAGTRVNVRRGTVDLRQSLTLGLAGAVAAPFGAAAALALDARVLGRLFGVLVLYSGLRMGLGLLRRSTDDDHAP